MVHGSRESATGVGQIKLLVIHCPKLQSAIGVTQIKTLVINFPGKIIESVKGVSQIKILVIHFPKQKKTESAIGVSQM